MTHKEESKDLESLCRTIGDRARVASRHLGHLRGDVKIAWLRGASAAILRQSASILEANAHDVAVARENDLSEASIDRLTLTDSRLKSIAQTLEDVAALPDPIGDVVRSSRRPNGLEVSQIRVPLGVIFMIYESRPNVTVDAAAICVKSGNAAILRGGKEAHLTNQALFAAMTEPHLMAESGMPEHAIQLVPTTNREAVGHLLKMHDRIDLTIPRGGESLIRRVVADATMPVLKHYHGNCHVYVDADADVAMAVSIIVNAKAQRPGVCNAAETLLVHRDIAERFLPQAAASLADRGVELRGDPRARLVAPGMKTLVASDWDTEFLDLILAVGVVDSLDEAIEHINRHGSGHTEAIITNDLAASRRFTAEVDSSAVVVNASTRFNDGGMLGLGAEIGISTDKIHARGPCGLQELTTTKWLVIGDGQVRT